MSQCLKVMVMVNSDKKDYQKAKKRKTRSPISMIDLDKIQEDESVSESHGHGQF